VDLAWQMGIEVREHRVGSAQPNGCDADGLALRPCRAPFVEAAGRYQRLTRRLRKTGLCQRWQGAAVSGKCYKSAFDLYRRFKRALLNPQRPLL
jgi:hypothetical protein